LTTYRECFNQAIAAGIAGATVLTANTRSARTIRTAIEQRLSLTKSAWLTPDVLPYGAFVERLYSDAVISGAVTVQSLEREQELQLWRQIIERSPAGREMLLPESAAALASESFRTAHEHNIALDSPLMNVSSDTRAFSGWAAEFRRQLASHHWTSPALFTRELIPRLSTLRLPSQLFVFLPETTPAQRNFLDALSHTGVQVSTPPEYFEHDFTATRYEFDGIEDELLAAAQWARQQVSAAPNSRIGVILFDLDRKLGQVESAFRSVLHPEQLLGQRTPSAFEIASPIALSEYPVVRCALQLLSLFAAPIDFHSFHSMLGSPYVDAAPEAAAKFLARVTRQARRQVSLEELSKWLHDSNDLPKLASAMDALPRHAAFSSDQPVAYWADISRQILDAFGWPGSVGLNSEEFQCTKSWRDLLSSVTSLELLDWRTDFRGYVARLDRAAAARNFKPETLNAPVQIMDEAESEGSTFDALWIASCTDDLWPDSPKPSPLIPIALLREAGVPLVGTPQSDARTSRITTRLLQCAPQVSLSLARRTGDEREQRWSPVFARFPRATDSIELPPPIAERFAPTALETISDASAPAVPSGEVVRGGTWLLQDQSNCPFRAFAIRRLGAKEAQGPNEALAPAERGKIVDTALQLVWEQLKDSEGLKHPDLAVIVETAVDDAMASVLPSGSGQWTARFRALERRRTIEVLNEWLALESTRAPFHVLGHQVPAELTLGGLTLRGFLDRLDEVGDAHVVLDYKTGASNRVSAWQVPRPAMPQLPFYVLAMQQQKFNLAGASFAVVRKGESTFRAYLRNPELLPSPRLTKKTFDALPFDDYTARWSVELERIASSFVQGDAAVDPRIQHGKSGSPCERCHLTALCRVGDLPNDESDSDPEGDNDE
jgi:ATP-dependent helicase/nuclease subunit B